MKRNIFLILTSLIFLIPLQLIAQTHHKVMVNQFGRNGYGAGATRQAEVRTKLINALDGLGFDMCSTAISVRQATHQAIRMEKQPTKSQQALR